jgi:hypothetical protein
LRRFGGFCAFLCLSVASNSGPNRLCACGPDFPNNLLSGGDAAVLVAPEASFARELLRMNLIPSRFQAIQGAGNFSSEASTAESEDLTAALKGTGVSDETAELVRSAHAKVRFQLQEFVADRESWENSRPWVSDQEGGHPGDAPAPPPKFPKLELPAGLPAEFADYLEGAIAWHNPALEDKGLARQAWERVLERPKAERRFKSTWAAFMLGRSWETNSPEKAVHCFQQVRELAQQGFKDSIGLAAASLGLEARIYLRQMHYERAVELYLDQLAAGDSSATNSLRFAAAKALANGGAHLRALAKNPRTQRVITGFLISQRATALDLQDGAGGGTADPQPGSVTRTWLAAVEAAEVKDVESAEELALAAYRANEMDLAQRWIKRAPGSPVAGWLQSKLLLRAGKVQAAAALLAKVAQYFPVAPQGTNEVAPATLRDTLFIDRASGLLDRIPIERQVLGELGVVRLARREYTQALDALLHAGFWMDAAFVAERVLTVDELKAYVDTHWPTVPARQATEEEAQFGADEVCPAKLREQIRYLLARRLTRSFRSDEARAYYPAEWVAPFDLLVQGLKMGWDETLSVDQRAKALFEAAVITRTNGMELIGTEVQPDWHIHGGEFEEGVTTADRTTNEGAAILVASPEEARRSTEHHADPEIRFHYRYQAAALAWEAAKLMPNNSDATARVLWTAGSWLKNRDPQTADLFYKALVWRNRKTALGTEADRRRWFPELDENGNIIRREVKPHAAPEELSSAEPPKMAPRENGVGEGSMSVDQEREAEDNESLSMPSDIDGVVNDSAGPAVAYEYRVEPGDSLASIVRAVAQAGFNTSTKDIFHANPGLDPTKLRVGQKLLIPLREP